MEEMLRYLDEIKEPAIVDLGAPPSWVRHALFGLRSYVPCNRLLGVSSPAYASPKQKFGSQSRDLRIVDEVAHAFKHVVSGSPANPKSSAGAAAVSLGLAGLPDTTCLKACATSSTILKSRDCDPNFCFGEAYAGEETPSNRLHGT